MTAALRLAHVDPAGSAFEPVSSQLPDEQLDLDQLGSRIVGLAGRLAAESCRWLLLIAAFDARDGCDSFGQASTAHWLAYACGLAHHTAREHVRVARALAAFPELAAAMGRGALSYSHARAIARAADLDDPAAASVVSDLLEIAEHGTVGQLESVVRGLRTVDDNDLPADERQYVRHSWTQQSMSQLSARLDPENGALVQSALDAIARAEELTPVEALVRMAELALVNVNDSSAPARRLRGDERAAVVIHLDATAVRPADGSAEPTPPAAPADPEPTPAASAAAETPPTCPPRPYARVADGPGLPDRVVTRLLCAGRIRTVVRDSAGSVLDLGRTRRLVDDRLYRALLIIHDSRCAHPGCRSRLGLEAHHVRHWLDGGRTDLANLVLLCPRHHHAHHDGAFSIRRLHGAFEFFRADGSHLPARVGIAPLVEPAGSLPSGPAVGAPRQPCGDRLDRHYAVSVLAHRRELVRRRARSRPDEPGGVTSTVTAVTDMVGTPTYRSGCATPVSTPVRTNTD